MDQYVPIMSMSGTLPKEMVDKVMTKLGALALQNQYSEGSGDKIITVDPNWSLEDITPIYTLFEGLSTLKKTPGANIFTDLKGMLREERDSFKPKDDDDQLLIYGHGRL
ncbi:hypothetical protein FQN50_009277 [Emmonsiellopsis sp. PD_5]|nr:hypothetical protein FQN50_009277 [Emmonsiellopsis sp. PD_5]